MSSAPKNRTPLWLARMEEILETLNQGVMIVAPEGVIMFANRVLTEMIGMTADDLFGRSALDFYCGADLEFLQKQTERGRLTGRNQYEFFLPRVDGRPLPVVLSARAIKSPDGIDFAVLTFTDITEQKDAENSLRRANQQLQDYQNQLQTELTLAAQVQQSLAPRAMNWGNVFVETFYDPVHTIGGDFGLVAVGGAPAPEGHLNLLVCDVSGHGIGSALIANRIYTETVSLLERHDDLGGVLRRLNSLVLEHIQMDGFFFTMAVARVDRFRRLHYAAAGHPPAIWVTPGGEVRMLEARSGALGVMDEAVASDAAEEIAMSPGDRLLLCTDGLTEVFNSRREMLGDDGLRDIVASHAAKPLPEMKRAILDEVAAWRHGPATDDMSLVLVEVG